MKRISFFTLSLFLIIQSVIAQTIPCNGNFLFTRQIPSSVPNSSYISQVNFIPNDINITNPGTLSPTTYVNASVQYGGYIWTQDWNASVVTTTSPFTLLRVNAAYNTTSYAITGMPQNSQFNNAGVDKNGLMYILTNANPTEIHTIDLSSGTPTFVSTRSVTFPGLATSESVIWGDISIDPITNRVYCWYHPTNVVTPLKGLYEITGLAGATPALVKVGVQQLYTLGSLFFNERGQLFGYGGALGLTQDRIFAIDKIGGAATQYGLPDFAVSQSDGCECNFRLSLDREVSVPILNIPKCGVDTFAYKFSPLNFSSGAITGITFSDTLDSRLSYAFVPANLQTQLQSIYGASVSVALTSFGGGVNNVVNITGMTLPLAISTFSLSVKVDASNFASSAIITQQAYLKGISTILGGPNEISNDPTTFNPKDGTGIAINLSGTRCLPPTANNFINVSLPQGNAATVIPPLTGADPDGVIVNFTVTTIPPAVQGVLSYCTSGNNPCTGGFANVAANTILTPAQNATLRFDPAPNFVGNATFTFTATDNTGNVSNAANYILPITSLPPVSNNIMENSIVNTSGPSPIVALNSADVDGTIASYTITSLPPSVQGNLYLNGVLVTTLAQVANLTPLQITQLSFDPTAGFVGNATFNYTATDNSGNISNTANYTIPVSATVTVQRPPLTDNITAQPLSNSLGNTAIPSLKGSDLDGSVVSYTVLTIPPAIQGVLRLTCPTTPAGLTCLGGFANILPNTILTPAESARLYFDPAPGYVGNALFTYSALDNSTLVSNISTYTIPVVNTPPTAININTTAPFNGNTLQIVSLGGTDLDGTVDTFKITTLPLITQGEISVPCGTVLNPTFVGATCVGGFQILTATVLANYPTGIPLTPTQASGIRFDPATGYSGVVTFNYFTKDNNANTSTLANYNITIQNQTPISNDITVTAMPNANGQTPITALSSSDPDGTISNYTILTLPPTTSGILFYNNGTGLVPVVAGQTLTTTQISTLQFDPALNYSGVVNFTYTATDNSGNVSNIANYNLPITGVGNLPPIAQNITAPSMPNTNGSTVIPNLVGSDPDGTVATYTILSIPTVSEGVLFYNNGTSLVPVVAGQILTPAQISTLQFDPSPNNNSPVVFTYSNTDNTNATSNIATYTIPVSSTPPIAQPIVAPTMPQTNGATAIPTLIGSDADGTIASYTIETIPPASQGILSLNGVAITAGQILTPLQITQLQFDPTGSYNGNVVFNYHATDNAGLLSNSTTYTIPVSGLPPISNDVLAPKMNNANGPTSIPGLASNDVDGSIATYVINSIPPASQGVLLLNGVPITLGQVLTPLEISQLQFDPAPTFNGDVIFNYSAFDNNGNISNIATYVIPVGTTIVLPLNLIRFTGERNTQNINLIWETSNEINVSQHEVYYSIDGINFIKIAVIKANNQQANNYSQTLYDFINPIYYFKIKTINNNGSSTFSNTIIVKNKENNTVQIHPNPIKNRAIITLGNDARGNYSIQLYNQIGSLVWNKVITNVQNNQQVIFERNLALGAGVYILKVTSLLQNTATVNKLLIE
jgi:Secretion system C-terminal sorting domain/Bacterial Ig domain